MEQPRLEITDLGATVYFKRYLYSRKNPARHPESIAKAVPIESQCLYFIASPLLGYGIETILNHIPEDSHIIGIEVSQALFHLCSPHIREELLHNPHFSLVRLSDEESLQALLEDLGLWRFRHVRRVNINAGAALYPELYSRLQRFAENALASYWRNRHALYVLGRHWVRHLFANLSLADPRPHNPSGKPIIVTGAGPSLEDALDFIKENRDSVEIWSTDTALGTLLSKGITPDIVSILETQAWNHLDFHDSHDTGIGIMADITSYPESLNITGGSIFFYSSAFAKLNLLKRLEITYPELQRIPALGSVGLSTVQLALNRSKGPIFLVGLDFAYSPGKTHARGSSIHRWQMSNITRTNPTPGWTETMCRPRLKAKGYGQQECDTDMILKGYADLFRDRFSTSDRLYLLTGGLDIGIPIIDSLEARRIMQEHRMVKNDSLDTELNSVNSQAILNFLGNEIMLLDQSINAWENYSEGNEDVAMIIQALEMIDHVYCDFPDKPPLPKADDGFLFRAIRRCRELRRYIGRVL